jgi:hypothetical protein
MMWCIQFVEAFVRDRERELLAVAKDSRAARKGARRVARSGTRAKADTTSADQPCCTPAAA